jgi:Dolichyl-phosphate-mannose-protein mannosyltransferase
VETIRQADADPGTTGMTGMQNDRIALQPMALYLSGLAIFLFILLFAGAAGKPLQLDNMDFPAAAGQTAATGLPIYYRGEESPRESGLYHPPLYIYLLAAWMKVFGSGEAAVRLFGMTCALIQGGVVLAIVGTLFGTAVAWRWGPAFWAIFLLNPYTLQTPAIADIDSTIYGPLLCLLLLAALRISWRNGERRTDEVLRGEYVLVGVALFFCFWAKLTTVLLVPPFLFFLWIARLGVKRAVVFTAAVAGAGAAAFVASYFLYGALTRMDVLYTFSFTWQSFLNRGSTGTPGLVARLEDQWRNLQFMGPFMLSWTGLLPWVAAGGAMLCAANGAIRRRDRQSLDYGLILGLAFISTWYYCAKVVTFGAAPYKYGFVYWGLILTAPLFLVTRYMGSDVPVRWRWAMAAGAFLYVSAALAAVTRMGDVLMLYGFAGLYRWAAWVPGLVFAMGLIRTRLSKLLLAGAVCVYCGLQLGIAGYQAKAPYATTYDYGQTGFMDTVGFIRSHTGPDDLIVSMKDIGYRSQRRYFENYAALYVGQATADKLIAVMDSGKAAFMIFTEGRGQDELYMYPPLKQWVLDHCTLVRSFGNYRIYALTKTLRRQREAECLDTPVVPTARSIR